MTIFVGMTAIDENTISASNAECLKNSSLSSLNLQSFSEEVVTSHFVIYQYDVGVFTRQFDNNSDDVTSAIAGQPIFSDGTIDTQADISLLNKHKNELPELLAKARGTFSGVLHNGENNKTFLFTDKIGVRPIFYISHSGYMYFSSNFSVLKNLFFDELKLCADGLKEYLTLGYSLDDKTAFNEIKRLKGSHLLEIGKDVKTSEYWDWSTIHTEVIDDGFYQDLYNIFQESVKLRTFEHDTAYSFLSGGLDSRAVTSSLIAQGKKLISFNFQTAYCQDTEYSKLYAEKAGINLKAVIVPQDDFHGWSRLIAKSINQVEGEHKGQYVWSGDGGAPIGGVYLNTKTIEAFADDELMAINIFLSSNNKTLLLNYFAGKLTVSNPNEIAIRMYSTLKSFPNENSKALFYSLLVNGQARNLQTHFETIHLHKIEMALPFFDSHFMCQVFKIPMHELAYHNAYAKWFEYFPAFTRKTPWQSYPGHVPCPVKYKSEFVNQWQMNKKKSIFNLQETLDILRILKSPNIRHMVSKKHICIKAFFHFLGLQNNTYIIDFNRKLKDLLES